MPDTDRQALADAAKLIGVKGGTRVVTRAHGTLNTDRIKSLAEQIHCLRQANRQVVLISS